MNKQADPFDKYMRRIADAQKSMAGVRIILMVLTIAILAGGLALQVFAP